ncbi:Protein of unknown function [Pyronema omphalodes CBS 100304]|uniref:Uncharacterized protein n=1 Tax=Pyronema omphalodes (strain CBS 100304) TaxID=1076935 RepID=U4LJE6_PYROM|nr:Protein of unknown function [Pyronema omphalodes CBS 100304]
MCRMISKSDEMTWRSKFDTSSREAHQFRL